MKLHLKLTEQKPVSSKSVVLYRMKLPDHECPYGLRAKQMLEDASMEFEDRLLTSREEVDAFEDDQSVATTPQVFIDGERIGGSEELASYLGTRGS